MTLKEWKSCVCEHVISVRYHWNNGDNYSNWLYWQLLEFMELLKIGSKKPEEELSWRQLSYGSAHKPGNILAQWGHMNSKSFLLFILQIFRGKTSNHCTAAPPHCQAFLSPCQSLPWGPQGKLYHCPSCYQEPSDFPWRGSGWKPSCLHYFPPICHIAMDNSSHSLNIMWPFPAVPVS